MKKAILFAVTTIASVSVFAQEAAATVTTAVAQVVNPNSGLVAISAAIAIGLAVYGGTSAQGKLSAAALEGIARNPAAQDKMFVTFILGLAFVESLAILAFLVAFSKLPAKSFGF